MTPSSPDAPRNHLRIEPFDPEIHVSPHALFRRLQDAAEGVGRVPWLVSLTLSPSSPLPTSGEGTSDPLPSPSPDVGRGEPRGRGPDGEETILIDQDGREATRRARELSEAGHERVYALYGGLELYDYALDPLVVGDLPPLPISGEGDRGGEGP